MTTLVLEHLQHADSASPDITIDSSGRIGIGTTSPDTLLHVNGQAKFENNITLNENTPALVVPNGDFRIFTGGSETMRITSGKDVSIGSDHPGFSGWRVLNMRQLSTGALVNFEDDDGTRAFTFASQGSGMRYQAHIAGGYHRWETNATANALYITDGGNIGIGTSSPSVPLEIIHGSSSVGLHTKGSYNWQAKFESTDAEAAIVIEDSNSTDNGNRIGVIANDMTFITADTEHMRITNDGYITTPYQPSFIARTNSTFNYTGGTGYATITNFGNVILNRSNSYNSSTGTFTAPVTGHYQFTFQLLLSNVASGDDSIHIAFYQNQSHQLNANIRSPGSAANSVVGYGQYLPVIGVGDMYMSANDTLQIKLSSSGTMNVYAGGDWGRFSGHLIG